ncbi:MAG: GNAT family N-acetyltransferase [Muribaculaceae bacterium]|nr:GNAT family N-acetyltransferase [Muribaculaceae bacterium]
MDFSKFTFRQIEADTDIKSFDCGDADLNDFLISDAKKYLGAMMALTYLLEDESESKTVAYYSLLNDKIVFDPEEKHFWNKLNRKISNKKRRKEYPAVKIGRLAVSKDYSGQHIGRAILLQIKHMFATMRRSACRFITVDAYAAAVPFYEKSGFMFMSEKDKNSRTRAMYFDLINFVD